MARVRRRSWYLLVFVAVKDEGHIGPDYDLPKSVLFEYTR